MFVRIDKVARISQIINGCGCEWMLMRPMRLDHEWILFFTTFMKVTVHITDFWIKLLQELSHLHSRSAFTMSTDRREDVQGVLKLC